MLSMTGFFYLVILTIDTNLFSFIIAFKPVMFFLPVSNLQKAGALFKNEPKKSGFSFAITIPKKHKVKAPPT